jgi:hypothetical protein
MGTFRFTEKPCLGCNHIFDYDEEITKFTPQICDECDSGFCFECGDWVYGKKIFRDRVNDAMCSKCLEKRIQNEVPKGDFSTVQWMNLHYASEEQKNEVRRSIPKEQWPIMGV